MLDGLNRWYWLSYRRRLLNRHLAQLQSTFPSRVLEIGAGRAWQGRRSLWNPPSGATRWTTVDLDWTRQPAVCADAEWLPFRPGCIELVVCLEMIEYVADPARVLRQIHDVLAPTGRLIVSAPFVHRWDCGNDRWRFSLPALTELLAGAGFGVETVFQQGSAVAAAANIMKFVWLEVAARFGVLRPVVGAAGLIMLEPLVLLDRPMATLLPELRRFSTGYLVSAWKRGAAAGSCP